jgi:hypothetical protein
MLIYLHYIITRELLYTQIRYVEEVRTLYRLRHMLASHGRPEIHSRLGFSKYSEQLRRIKNILKQEHVLDRTGRFVESEPNIWLARLPLVADRRRTRLLGYRLPYNVFLALTVTPRMSLKDLPRDLKVDAHSTALAMERMSKAGIITKDTDHVKIDGRLSEWLLRYIELAKSQAKATDDISYLFRAIPSYITGPRAFYDLHYEPGRPIAPADMVVATYEPFRSLWGGILRDIPYFQEYPHKVTIGSAGRFDVTWVDGLPYERGAKLQKRPAE